MKALATLLLFLLNISSTLNFSLVKDYNFYIIFSFIKTGIYFTTQNFLDNYITLI